MSGDPFKLRRLRNIIMVTFGFSRSEARAFLVLLPLIFLIVFSQPIYRSFFMSGKPDNVDDVRQLDSLLATLTWHNENQLHEKEHELFHFNPNTVTSVEMDSLGIKPAVAQRIERYRSKGGKFRTRSDLQKMYGFDSALFSRLEPFIDLPINIPKAPAFAEKKPDSTRFAARLPPRIKETFDLNVADTLMLDGIYGIGPALARRIIAYREKLGGFVNENQLYEIWGLDSAVIEQTKERTAIADDFVPKSIKINTATEAELASHPYIKPKTARLIVAYRFQHGKFSAIEDIEKTIFFDAKTFNRIKPYLTLE
jgi:competence protein ComEA